MLMYGKLEEEHGLAKRAMNIYERATREVGDEDRFDVSTLFSGNQNQVVLQTISALSPLFYVFS